VDKNFRLIIEYDGSAYHGWQRQTGDRTIQQTIEAALAEMTGQRPKLIGSGRTDAGVHALGQVANFHCDTALRPQAFLGGLNSLLPDDVVIRECRRVGDGFHARYDATGKTYAYRLVNRDLPGAIGRQYEWWVRMPLNREAMAAAAQGLTGTHDFSAFEGAGSPRSHATRTVTEAVLQGADEDRLVFRISADGFLRFMVRNIVGTLVDVGLGKTPPAEVERILRSQDRSQAGVTAPPHGLFLMSVQY